MTLQKHIANYIENQLPLWDCELTKLLAENKWNELSSSLSLNETYKYSISNCVNKKHYTDEFTIPLLDNILIAIPSDSLKPFYEKHSLNVTCIEDEVNILIPKINGALRIIKNVPEAFSFIKNIVKSVQIINSEFEDTDTSYSHPDIPFSIFFSVCNDSSTISNLRVAESILHESMHLLLTLAEQHLDFILPNTMETYYSPWREEQRHVRGVLHGMFVFKAIKDFYKLLLQKKEFINSEKEKEFLKFRIIEIENEMQLITNFPSSEGLTNSGKTLALKLLK